MREVKSAHHDATAKADSPQHGRSSHGGGQTSGAEPAWAYLAPRIQLRGSGGEVRLIPRQIADQLRGRTFNNFGEFREEFWRLVAADPVLSAEFGQANQAAMGLGHAAVAPSAQHVAGGTASSTRVYTLHHINPIERGGGVYDLDNLVIVAPAYHADIHY